MPQMAPYNWLMLNLFFSMILLMYIIFINFIIPKKKIKKINKQTLKYLIKW